MWYFSVMEDGGMEMRKFLCSEFWMMWKTGGREELKTSLWQLLTTTLSFLNATQNGWALNNKIVTAGHSHTDDVRRAPTINFCISSRKCSSEGIQGRMVRDWPLTMRKVYSWPLGYTGEHHRKQQHIQHSCWLCFLQWKFEVFLMKRNLEWNIGSSSYWKELRCMKLCGNKLSYTWQTAKSTGSQCFQTGTASTKQ